VISEKELHEQQDRLILALKDFFASEKTNSKEKQEAAYKRLKEVYVEILVLSKKNIAKNVPALLKSPQQKQIDQITFMEHLSVGVGETK